MPLLTAPDITPAVASGNRQKIWIRTSR